jgi:small-conductance mechanosensitive channel
VGILINIIDIGFAALLFGAALAFGLGAKTAVSNILATFYVRKMYKVGDQVKIDDIQGKIAKIDDTSVVIDTQAGQVIVPAKNFSESKSFLIN